MVDKTEYRCTHCGAALSDGVENCPNCKSVDERFPTSVGSTRSIANPDKDEDTQIDSRPGDRKTNSNSQISAPAFGEYELLGEIARGGMGVVYKARQIKANRVVALKMILSHRLSGRDSIDRFHQEAEAAARLDHPNIVPVHDVGEVDGQHYFTMGFVDGSSLKAFIQNGPLANGQSAEIIHDLARALAYAHNQGIVHRDIKPSNILLRHSVPDESRSSKDGSTDHSLGSAARFRPMITDFGLAKQIDSDSELTTSGQVLGTPQFMAPEQARGDVANIGAAADIYSLGATLYQLITGRPPHLASSMVDTLQQVLNDEPVPPSQVNPSVDRDLETICLKCLRKDPGRRYGEAGTLAAELQRYLNGEPILARPVGKLERVWRWCRRNPTTAALLTTVVASLLLGIVFSSYFAVVANRRAVTADFQSRRANSNAEDFRRQRDFAMAETRRADEKAAEVARQRDEVTRQKNKLREQLYWNYISSAHHQWQAGQIESAWNNLIACEEDLHTWEYDYLRTLFTKNRTYLNPGETVTTCLEYSKDGTRLISGDSSGTIKLWDVESKRTLLTIPHKRYSFLANVAVRDVPELAGVTLFAGYSNGTVKIWFTGLEMRTQTLATPCKKLFNMAVSPDGKQVAVSGEEKTVWIIDILTGRTVSQLESSELMITDIAFSPNGKRVAAGDQDFKARIWDIATEECIAAFNHFDRVGAVAFSPDGKFLASTTWHGDILVWDLATSEKLHEKRNAHETKITSIQYSDDGKQILTGSEDHLIKEWNADVSLIRTHKGHWGRVSKATYRAGGRQIASAGRSSPSGESIVLWEANDGPGGFTFLRHYFSNVMCLSYNQDGTRMVSAGLDFLICVWDMVNHRQLMALPAVESVWSVHFSPDGKQFVTGGNTSNVRVWNTETGEVVLTMKGHEGSVESVLFSPDGNRIFSCGADNTIKVWNAKTGDNLHTIEGEEGRIFGELACSPDGRRLACANSDFSFSV